MKHPGKFSDQFIKQKHNVVIFFIFQTGTKIIVWWS